MIIITTIIIISVIIIKTNMHQIVVQAHFLTNNRVVEVAVVAEVVVKPVVVEQKR